MTSIIMESPDDLLSVMKLAQAKFGRGREVDLG
jgi:hypothetical protein